MNDLDRFIQLEKMKPQAIIDGLWTESYQQEYQSLYEKLKKAEELQNKYKETMETLNKEDLFYYLMDEKYWDLKRFGSFFKLETRQEYDKETCLAIRDMIIDLIKSGGSNQKSQEDVEKIKKYDILFKNWQSLQIELTNKIDENQQLKEEILHLTALLNMPENKTHKQACELLDRVCSKNNEIRKLQQDSKTNAEKIERFSNMIYHAECGRLPENWIKECREILKDSDKI